MTAEWPHVTAVVTVYDRFEPAKRAVRSAVEQTYEPLDVIVVEDGTDVGIEEWLVERYPSVEYVRHDRNLGLAAARNTAMNRANGDFVAYLDDDDWWRPRRIEAQVRAFLELSPARRDRVGVVYCGVERRRAGRVVSYGKPENLGPMREAISEIGASTIPSSCLFPVGAIEAVGGYDEDLPSSIDHDIWMALADAGYEAVGVDEPLVVVDDEFGDGMMTNTDDRIEGVYAFVEKWRPTYREWFGPAAGDRYADRYFARVVARLAAANVVTGQWGDARRAVEAIFAKNPSHAFNATTIGYHLIEASLKRFLPARAVRAIARLAG